MERMLKKIGLSDKKSAGEVSTKPEDRGKLKDEEEIRNWYSKSKTGFTELPKEGQEAFFRYLCGDKYPEDKDICDIDPKAAGMNTKSRRYQFWLKCEKIELLKLFDDYLTDDDTRLPEVEGCFNESQQSGEEDDMEVFLSKKKDDAGRTDSFFGDLKSKMKLELDSDFSKFRDEVSKRLSRKT